MELKMYMVGLRCVGKAENTGCECTSVVPEDINKNFKEIYGFDFSDNCHYDIIQAKDESDLTLDECLKKQNATEYENAIGIWIAHEVIGEFPSI